VDRVEPADSDLAALSRIRPGRADRLAQREEGRGGGKDAHACSMRSSAEGLNSNPCTPHEGRGASQRAAIDLSSISPRAGPSGPVVMQVSELGEIRTHARSHKHEFRSVYHGLGISGGGDKVLGDCVRAGAVTDDHIDGATGHPRASPSVVVLPLL
jgi:hypothetical protein